MTYRSYPGHRCGICHQRYHTYSTEDYRHQRGHVARGEAVELVRYLANDPGWPYRSFVPPDRVQDMLYQGWELVQQQQPEDKQHGIR